MLLNIIELHPYSLSRQGWDCVCLISFYIAMSSLAQINAFGGDVAVSINRWPEFEG
jgi:hypothetical protein